MERSLARRQVLGAGAALSAVALLGGTAQAADRGTRTWPTRFPLPDGWEPEGIAIGFAPYAYFGSIAGGGVYRVDLATGEGKIVHAGLGRQTIGLKLDAWGRLFLAGGSSGELRVVDARTGELLASHAVGGTGGFVNDVVLTEDAAWFTESFGARLHRLPLGRRGRLAEPETIELGGDWVQSGFTANGIARTPDGSGLLVTNAAVDGGSLMRVDPRTGAARQVDLGATTLPGGDGLALVGRTLYVVRPTPNQVDVIRLNRSGTRGTAIGVIRDDRFDLPTTAAVYRGRLYLPNSRFSAPVRDADTPYDAVCVPLVPRPVTG
ncbi:superoxide dismutase [Streptomyces sp. DSM 3412]|uniref:Superoxide dismutase n=1 Tax=Streptomyces gottesmaniae TaxID=3075518 RepID=A0ABU2Z5X5_9ACTN|nr:superoxide dismutase [Streptomyces sp. DSM 3412]MDT0571972.1 superoxide dismutase [Streptomyces sp. DSM 3412]